MTASPTCAPRCGALAPDIILGAQSLIYETAAWGYEDQPAFLNMVVAGPDRPRPPRRCSATSRHLENELGRTPTFHWGPRLIDIDILFYDDLVLDTPELMIPHPQPASRAFVLVPLADVAPDLVHPVLGRTIDDLLSAVDTSGIQPFKDTGMPGA